MAAAAPVAPPSAAGPLRGVQPLRAGEGNSFLWRKLHSLSGIVPIGAFLVEHIVSNFETMNGPLAYAQQVKFLNGLPLVRVLEWGLIFIPLAFHALYGVWIALRGRVNVNVYPWAGNWAYVMQRVTGIIAFVYIVQHVWRQRFAGVQLPEHPGAAFHKVQVELANPLDAGDLCDRDGGYVLALRLRDLVVCGEVGDYAGGSGAEAVGVCLRGVWGGAVCDGVAEYLGGGFRAEVPERSGGCDAGAAGGGGVAGSC